MDSRRIRLIDVFPYNGDPIVEMRLSEVYPFVDEIIVIEMLQTFTGIQKDAFFIDAHAHVFDPYRDKIHFIRVDHIPDTPDMAWTKTRAGTFMAGSMAWWRENYQRECVLRRLREIDGPYVAIMSDADEIPNVERIVQRVDDIASRDTIVRLEMAMFNYSFRWMKPRPWYHAFVLSDKAVAKAMDDRGIDYLRCFGVTDAVIERGGWHCSNFMDAHDIQKKIASFAHTEFDMPDYRSLDHIRACMATGKDLFDRGEDEDAVPRPPDVPLPRSVDS